jgi:hypothetical protein
MKAKRRRGAICLLLILAVAGQVISWPDTDYFFIAEGPDPTI